MANEPITRNEEFMKAVDEIMTGNITPITREEILWAKVLGENVPDIVPVIRKEIFLAKIAGADIQTPTPITREEMYLDAIANGTELKLKPITRKEMFYAKAIGLTDSAPEPVTRLEQILDQVETSGGGTGGGGEENYDKYSWEGVLAAIKNGTYKDIYKLGDLVPIDLGEYGIHNMQIVAFDTDDKADGSGKAAISWVSETLITKRVMNTVSTNENGWVASELRSWLQGDFYAILPADVKASIVSINKTFFDCTTQSTLSCVDNVWIPSVYEVFGRGSEDSGVSYTGCLKDRDTRTKKFDGVATIYWLRSAYNYSDRFYYCDNNGLKNYGNSKNSYGVALCFCT